MPAPLASCEFIPLPDACSTCLLKGLCACADHLVCATSTLAPQRARAVCSSLCVRTRVAVEWTGGWSFVAADSFPSTRMS